MHKIYAWHCMIYVLCFEYLDNQHHWWRESSHWVFYSIWFYWW